jgi:hypothetical protein
MFVLFSDNSMSDILIIYKISQILLNDYYYMDFIYFLMKYAIICFYKEQLLLSQNLHSYFILYVCVDKTIHNMMEVDK